MSILLSVIVWSLNAKNCTSSLALKNDQRSCMNSAWNFCWSHSWSVLHWCGSCPHQQIQNHLDFVMSSSANSEPLGFCCTQSTYESIWGIFWLWYYRGFIYTPLHSGVLPSSTYLMSVIISSVILRCTNFFLSPHVNLRDLRILLSLLAQ